MKRTLFYVLCMMLQGGLLEALATTNPPPAVQSFSFVDDSSIEIDVMGKLGKRYRLDTATALGEWSEQEPFTPVTSNFGVIAYMDTGSVANFFRISMLPATNPPVWDWARSYPLSVSPDQETNLVLQWRAPDDLLELSGYRIYQNDVLVADLSPTTFVYQVTGLTTGQLYRFRIESGNEDGIWTTNGLEVAVRPAPGDPSSMATVPGNGIPTLVGESIRFLFDGSDAVQTGVDTNVLESYRLSALQGIVRDVNSNVMAGVAVSVLGEPAYGITYTRTNGMFDLAVNGGSALVLCFERYGCLPVQRTVDVPWQEGVHLSDVFMLGSDTNLSQIDLTNAAMKMARGPVVSDAEGSRRAMVLMPPGARASVLTYEGTTQEVDRLTTRFTEYTEGSSGLNAMPGDMLPSVAYTYCVELGSLEAEDKVDGRDVLFNTNVFFYVDNFLSIPAGIPVPMGYYDNDSGAWVPSRDGICITLMGTNEQGLARICANTNGLESDAAELLALEFTDEERQTLATTYPSATNSLWRVPIQHFSTYDCNYGVVPEDGAEEPQVPPAVSDQTVPAPRIDCGNSGIEIENQTLTELIPIQSTPYYLVYSSQTAAQNPKFRSLRIPVSGSQLPTNIVSIRLNVSVAGRNYTYDLPAETNQHVNFTWDGMDDYGRQVNGAQGVTYSVAYLYPGYYSMPPAMSASFGASSGKAIPGMIRSREPAVLRQTIRTTVGTFNAASRGLGGWMLDIHHVYDPVNKRLYLGNGHTQEGIQLMTRSSEVEWITDIVPLENKPSWFRPRGIAVGADGSLYVASESDILRITRSGQVSSLATLPTYADLVACAPDGSVYATAGGRVYKITMTGRVTPFTGSGYSGLRIPDVPADQLQFNCQGLAVATDGTVFMSDLYSNVIWRVGPDGMAHIAAGKLATYGGYDGEDLPARESALLYPKGVTFAQNGRLYICDKGNERVRVVTASGFLQTIAGNGSSETSGDGSDARDAGVPNPAFAALGIDGSTFVLQQYSVKAVIRQILPDGRIITIAGDGDKSAGMGMLAKNIQLPCNDIRMAAAPDGSLYLSDTCSKNIYRLRPATRPLEQDDTLLVASTDASEVYVFDQNGRHLRTLDAFIGATNLTFSYTTNGFLSGITDRNGQTTVIHRNSEGFLTSIEAPGGHTTSFMLNTNNTIDTANAPGSRQYTAGYSNTLLSTFTDPRGFTSSYQYDEDGNLVKYVRKDGGTGTLSRVTNSNGWIVVHTTPLGVAQSIETELTSTGSQWSRTRLLCGCGSDSDTLISPDGLTSNVNAEGEITMRQTAPDPRFGMQAPTLAWSTYKTPGGLIYTISNAITAGIPDPEKPQQFTVMTNEVTINGRTYRALSDRVHRRKIDTTPMNRTITTEYDARGRPVMRQTANINAVHYGYDDRGNVSSITNGSGSDARISRYVFNSSGKPVSSMNPAYITTQYAYNEADYMTNLTVASTTHIQYTRDASGNILTIRTPEYHMHSFSYTPDNLIAAYYPPSVGGSSNATYWSYLSPEKLHTITFADGVVERFDYDEAGRLAAHAYPGGGEVYQYGGPMGGAMLTGIHSSNGVSLSYTYDGSIMLEEIWSGPVTGSVSRRYDNNLWVTNLLVNGTEIATFEYDADGLPSRVGPLQVFHDEINGLVTGTVFGLVTDASAYNNFGELTRYRVDIGSSNLYEAAFQRDGLGRVTNEIIQMDGTSITNIYAYDAQSRYLRVTTNGTTRQWLFDADGNITNVVHDGYSIATASYDAEDRIERWQTNTYRFTARGTLATAEVDTVTTVFDYDARSALLGLTRSSGSITNLSYLIDGKGRRIARTANGVRTHGYLYSDTIHPVAILNPDNSIAATLIYQPLASTPSFMTAGTNLYRIISDRLGSPLYVIDSATGVIVQRQTYDVWGRVTSDSSPLFQPLGFAGGLYDPASGLVRFGARDYDSSVGRWTTKDPLLSHKTSMNLYRYCNNDPVNRIDAMGLADYPTYSEYPKASAEMLDKIYEYRVDLEQRYDKFGKDIAAKHIPAMGSEDYQYTLSSNNDDIYPMGASLYDQSADLSYLRGKLKELERQAGKRSWWEKITEKFGGSGGGGNGAIAAPPGIAPCAQ